METFWRTKKYASAGIMGCYNALKPRHSLHMMEFDTLTANVIPYNEANGMQAIGKDEHLSITVLIGSLRKNCYVDIGRVNTLIANVRDVDMDESEEAKTVGGAKFLRAFYYLSLVDKFGGVLLIIDASNTDEQVELPRNSKEEVTNQIVKDLGEAAAVLSDTYASSNLERATRGAALALKARILLYNSRRVEMVQTAKQVIEFGVYQLFNDYRYFFSEDNRYNCEIIFGMEAKLPEYPTDYDRNIWRLNRPAPLKKLVDTYLCIDGKVMEESSFYDPACPYENRDPYLLKLIVYIGYPCSGKTTTKEDVVTMSSGVKKYTSYEGDVTIPLVERPTSSFILARHAEVPLTYAEAQNETNGSDQSVYNAISQLCRRPDIDMPEIPKGSTKDQMCEVIRRERRIELTFEGLYYSDILRWRTAEKESDGTMHNYEGIEVVKHSFNPKRDYLWPIPYNQTALNPNPEQNPNWG